MVKFEILNKAVVTRVMLPTFKILGPLNISKTAEATNFNFDVPFAHSKYYANKKTWQLRMHCNFRSPDATPFGFNYDAAKFVVAEPIHCGIIAFFAVDTLLYAVNLTFDLVILTCVTCCARL